MPHKKYLVTLTPEERQALADLLAGGKRSALALTRARILLKADQAEGGPAWEDAQIAEALDCGHRTVERLRQRFVERGLDAAPGAPQPPAQARRRRRGPAHCPGLFGTPGRPSPLDAEVTGRPPRRAGNRRLDL